MRRSLRARLTAGFMLSLAVWMSVACGGVIWHTKREADRASARVLRQAAATVRSEWPDAVNRDDPRDMFEDLAQQNLAGMVVGPDGRVISASQRQLPEWPRRRQDGWRVQAVRAGHRTIVIGLWWAPIASRVHAQGLALIDFSVIVLIAATVGAWVLVGRALSPISRLAHQARSASTDDLRVALTAPSGDAEILGLVNTLNGLLDRLRESAAAKGRFYAAASHELRTPLQALCGHLELAASRPRSCDEYRVLVAEARAQAERIVSLVQSLLLLNRLETQPATAREVVDIVAICDDAVTAVTPIINQRGLHLAVEMPSAIEVAAIPTHAQVLVRNLVENAVRYATEGGHVRMELGSTPRSARFVITNDCDTLAEADMQRLFEPFYRPDAARSAHSGGNGLGLAICKSIADANGWRIGLGCASGIVRCEVDFGSTRGNACSAVGGGTCL